MINQNNINKYGVECYKTTYQLVQKLRGQELMIIKELRAITGLKLSDAKIVIEDIKNNEDDYCKYLYTVDIAESADDAI